MIQEEYLNPEIDLVIIDADSILWRSSAAVKENDPVEHALHNVKNSIEKILDFCNPETYTIYVGGNSNFRKEIATIRPYKGNRNQPKPRYYPDCLKYLSNNWGVEIAENQEADDLCAIEHTKAIQEGIVSCIAGIDKDLYQLSGWHFNYVKDKLFWVDALEAKRNFWIQMLVGDTSDNIQGVEGIGKKKADGILAACLTESEMIEAVTRAYKVGYKNQWLEAMTENGRLLHLRRFENEEWQCPAT